MSTVVTVKRKEKLCSCVCIRSYFVVIGSMLCMFCMGLAITFGNLDPYLASYLTYINLTSREILKNECTKDISILYSSYLTKVPWIYSTVLIFQALLGPVGGKLDLKLGPRKTILIGSIIMVIGLFASYFSLNNVITLVVTLGVIFGSGFGVSFTGVILASTSWWPYKKGIVFVTVFMDFGTFMLTCYVFTSNVCELICPFII